MQFLTKIYNNVKVKWPSILRIIFMAVSVKQLLYPTLFCGILLEENHYTYKYKAYQVELFNFLRNCYSSTSTYCLFKKKKKNPYFFLQYFFLHCCQISLLDEL